MKRKEFLRNSAMSAVGLLIANKTISGMSLQENKSNPSGVKITKITPYLFKGAAFVKIECSEGISGWGECDSANKYIVPKVIDRELSQYLIGEDPFNSEYLWNQMYYKEEDLGRNGILSATIAGIDNAIWDLKGKLLGVPTYKLLGGAKRDKIRVYASYGRSKGGRYQTPDEMAKIAADFVEKGYTAVKPRMQIRQLGLNPDPDPTFDVIKAVRNAVGDKIKIFVDFNNGYTAARAIMVAKKIHEHFNVELIEEPVTFQTYSELRQVVDALDIPVSAGEHEYNKWEMKDLIIEGNVDYVNADVIKCGGITECKKVAGLANAFDKLIMTHNARPTLATAANLQFLASTFNAAKYQEYAGERKSLKLSELFENYFEFKDGYLIVPQTPGLGLVPNEKAMKLNKIN